MKREGFKYLGRWYQDKKSKPLIIRGARQVGKSTLVQLFCEMNQIDLISFNFEVENLREIESESFSLKDLINEIEVKKNKKITDKSIVFFDEIQEVPKLIKLLRYFYEEYPQIKVIAAGSLLEIALKSGNYSFPVGRVEFYHLGPMSFSEFLIATNRDLLNEKINEGDLNSTIHQEGLKALREFIYVGGMPQAVKEFSETGGLLEVRRIQSQILQAYQMDFPKYNRRIDVQRITRIFSSAALNVGKKVIYSKIDRESASRETKRVLELLVDARVLLPCYHSEGNSSPLAGESDSSLFKLYFIDIGLLVALLNLNLEQIDLEFKNQFNAKGFLAEQFVAQHLFYANSQFKIPQLYYHLKDKGSQKAEIDFLYEDGPHVFPIEVRSTAKGHLKSLKYFSEAKSVLAGIKMSIAPFLMEKNIFSSSHLISLPLYAINALNRVINKV